MSKHTMTDLHQMQAMPLEQKIKMTKRRVDEWIDEYGEDGVYISFSGGKDSTVLLDLVRNEYGYKGVKAMFVDVPTQYPELKKFAVGFENVDVVKPKKSFAKVCEEYGFPLISKEVSECVYGAKRYWQDLKNNALVTDRQTPLTNVEFIKDAHMKAIRGGCDTNINTKSHTCLEQCDNQAIAKMSRGAMTTNGVNLEELVSILNRSKRLAKLLGILRKDNQIMTSMGDGQDKSLFSQEKWQFFLEAPFEISNKCCDVMKKKPAHDYYKQTGLKPIVATMASESRLRTQKWLQNGCNGFDLKIPTSTPMSFWTEQDVLLYTYLRDLPICSVYGDVVEDCEIDGQMNINSLTEHMGIFDYVPTLKTTGCKRTGCVLCGFGCHLEKEGDERFVNLKKMHYGLWTLLDKIKNNGITYREAIEWTNEHGGTNIKLE